MGWCSPVLWVSLQQTFKCYEPIGVVSLLTATAHFFYLADIIIAHLLWRPLAFRFLSGRAETFDRDYHSLAQVATCRRCINRRTRRGRHIRVRIHRGRFEGGLRPVEELDQIGYTRMRSSNVHRGNGMKRNGDRIRGRGRGSPTMTKSVGEGTFEMYPTCTGFD